MEGQPRKISYRYDELNRLAGVRLPDGTYFRYQYDPTGNLVQVAEDGRDTPEIQGPVITTHEAGPGFQESARQSACPGCGARVHPGARFCPKCGTAREDSSGYPKQPDMFCPSCGNRIKAGSKFCTRCGRKMG